MHAEPDVPRPGRRFGTPIRVRHPIVPCIRRPDLRFEVRTYTFPRIATQVRDRIERTTLGAWTRLFLNHVSMHVAEDRSHDPSFETRIVFDPFALGTHRSFFLFPTALFGPLDRKREESFASSTPVEHARGFGRTDVAHGGDTHIEIERACTPVLYDTPSIF
eukprot:scaffold1583_cov257-Pavlova_lutheri.AAC.1